MSGKKLAKKTCLRNAEYYDMQPTFDKLYADSMRQRTFTNLMCIIASAENIMLAYRSIKNNSGSHTPGVDGKNITHVSQWESDGLIRHVQKKLEWYTPQAVKRVEIPKGNGKTRPLGIPTIMDRLIQQCFMQVLEPICEAKFHDRSNGFRPNRGAEHALAQAERYMQRSNLHYVVDIDIKGFFDNVSHGKLLKQMWTMGIRDKAVLSIISKMLKAEVAGIGFPERGTPQGGIISPLLSNIVLNELDWWIASQWESFQTHKEYYTATNRSGSLNKGKMYRALKGTSLKECFIVRYADDFKIFCRNRADAEKMFIATKDWLKERLGLDISPEKSQIVNLRKQYSDFLGFKLKVHPKGKKPNGDAKYVVKSKVSDKAKCKIKAKAKEAITAIQDPKDAEEEYRRIQNYNAKVMGWHALQGAGDQPRGRRVLRAEHDFPQSHYD